MINKGQIVNLKHKAKQFVVMDVKENMVAISFTKGHLYEICRDGSIFDCNFRNTGKRRLLRQSNDKRGYKLVNVRANNHSISMKVHRLVAMCFLPNPNNLPQVNHKDENPANNCASNLEWCDQKYNTNYSISRLKSSKKYMKAKLTKDKVKAMMPKDCIFIPCDTVLEADSAYQTALQAKKEMGENGNNIVISKSNVTLTVVVRTGMYN